MVFFLHVNDFPDKEVFMNKQTPKKLHRSERDMRNSMLRLMKNTPYRSITVTMLTDDAGINRKTFYAHFKNKDELLYAMIYDMFNDLFSCFMYPKDLPGDTVNDDRLQEDARNFINTILEYQESLDVLITAETSEFSITIADQVVMNLCRDTRILKTADSPLLQKFYLETIRNFFIGIIDAWIESEEVSLDEGVAILTRIIKLGLSHIFHYQK